MKKIFFSIFLILFFSSSVNADWTKVVTSTNGSTLYMDKNTLKIGKDTRFILIMLDYSKPTKYGDRSSRSYREINCNNMMHRDFVKDYFILPFAKGGTSPGSGARNNPEWNYSPPKSIGGILHAKVCKLKKY
tara:strand:+ start:206 stop:601 length:396 start_codon:yes stop_codon:yes gene_type:complete